MKKVNPDWARSGYHYPTNEDVRQMLSWMHNDAPTALKTSKGRFIFRAGCSRLHVEEHQMRAEIDAYVGKYRSTDVCTPEGFYYVELSPRQALVKYGRINFRKGE